MDTTVRPAAPDDVPAIRRIGREAWHAAYDDVIGETAVDRQLSEWYDEASLRASVTDDGQVFVVAETGRIRGFASAVPDTESDRWHLARIYVDPDDWGEGVGTAMLDRVETALRERGVDAYELAVMADNDVGVSFYETRGFERTDTRTVELGGVETTEHWYRKEL